MRSQCKFSENGNTGQRDGAQVSRRNSKSRDQRTSKIRWAIASVFLLVLALNTSCAESVTIDRTETANTTTPTSESPPFGANSDQARQAEPLNRSTFDTEVIPIPAATLEPLDARPTPVPVVRAPTPTPQLPTLVPQSKVTGDRQVIATSGPQVNVPLAPTPAPAANTPTATTPIPEANVPVAPTPRPTPGPISRQTRFVPLDEPKYVTRDQASANITNASYVLGISSNDEARAYPLDMMWFHHIANDTVGGEPWLVTY